MAQINTKELYYQGKNDPRKYEECITACQDEQVREGFNEWDYLFLGRCYYSLKRYEDYLTLYKEFHKKFPESDKLDDNMCWCVYYMYIKDFDFQNSNRRKLIQQADYVIEKSTDSIYSPKARVAKFMVDAIVKQKLSVNIDYKLEDHYLSLLNPLELESTPRQTVIKGRDTEILSEQEQWYSRKSKALVKLGRYEECLNVVEDGLKTVPKFHNNGDCWLKYHSAECYFAMGDVAEAEKVIQDLMKRLKHWALYQMLFRIAATQEKNDDALRYGALCATADPEHKLRVSFYIEFADFLQKNGYTREAALHVHLVDLIRQEEGWREATLPTVFQFPEDITVMDKRATLKELNKFWTEQLEKGKEYHIGEIFKVFPDGNSGFIQAEDGTDYYFNGRDFKRRPNELKLGLKVRFTLEERLDKKKNEMKLNAVEISLVK